MSGPVLTERNRPLVLPENQKAPFPCGERGQSLALRALRLQLVEALIYEEQIRRIEAQLKVAIGLKVHAE